MDKLILEYPWLPKTVETAKEYGVDWLRISAMIILSSNGDPRARVIDYNFIDEYLGEDSPMHTESWVDGRPNIDIIDKGTKWGLLQIHGLTALDYGFKGRLINLTDIGINVKIGCKIFTTLIGKGSSVIQATNTFGACSGFTNEDVESLMARLREAIQVLSNIETDEDVHESIGH